MKAKHLVQGDAAEEACASYLKSQGLKYLSRNYHCQYGEIDIIMRDKNLLVFVEVRFRKNNLFGSGLESVTITKQAKLRKTAEYYLQHNTQYNNARFDVVSVSKNAQSHYTFNWVKNAF